MSMTNDQAAAIIKPVVKKFDDFLEAGKVDEVAAMYEKDAVLVTKGASAAYGRDAIKEAIAPFAGGLFETKLSNAVYEGVGNHIIYRGDFNSTVKKDGTTFKGSFQQIFRKNGSEWLIVHDEFCMA